MTAPLAREARIYSALWKRGLSGQPIPITMPTHHAALSLRMAMYRFLKPYRLNPLLDPVLTDCAERLAISVPHKPSTEIIIREKVSLDFAEIAALQAELTDNELMSEMERDLKLLAVPDNPDEEAAKLAAPNPFFTR